MHLAYHLLAYFTFIRTSSTKPCLYACLMCFCQSTTTVASKINQLFLLFLLTYSARTSRNTNFNTGPEPHSLYFKKAAYETFQFKYLKNFKDWYSEYGNQKTKNKKIGTLNIKVVLLKQVLNDYQLESLKSPPLFANLKDSINQD